MTLVSEQLSLQASIDLLFRERFQEVEDEETWCEELELEELEEDVDDLSMIS